MYPVHKDSTWTVIDSDGMVNVKAKKRESRMITTDGESFYFEVFSADGYHRYSYGSPHEYSKYKPNIAELRKVIAILHELDAVF